MPRVLPFPLRRMPPEPLPLAELYDNAAGSWQDGIDKLGFDEAYARLIRSGLKDAPHRSGLRVLDAGCGTGALSVAYCNELTGPPDLDLLDLSPAMLDEARRALPFARPITGAIGTQALDAERYDRVLCAHVIEHCTSPQEALDWLAGRLDPGGVMFLAVSKPHWCTTLVRWRWKHRAFRPREVLQMLENAGMTDVQAVQFRKGPPSRVSCGYIAKRT